MGRRGRCPGQRHPGGFPDACRYPPWAAPKSQKWQRFRKVAAKCCPENISMNWLWSIPNDRLKHVHWSHTTCDISMWHSINSRLLGVPTVWKSYIVMYIFELPDRKEGLGPTLGLNSEGTHNWTQVKHMRGLTLPCEKSDKLAKTYKRQKK